MKTNSPTDVATSLTVRSPKNTELVKNFLYQKCAHSMMVMMMMGGGETRLYG
jgi:hypothetical protein